MALVVASPTFVINALTVCRTNKEADNQMVVYFNDGSLRRFPSDERAAFLTDFSAAAFMEKFIAEDHWRPNIYVVNVDANNRVNLENVNYVEMLEADEDIEGDVDSTVIHFAGGQVWRVTGAAKAAVDAACTADAEIAAVS